jgi:hypothetical protein
MRRLFAYALVVGTSAGAVWAINEHTRSDLEAQRHHVAAVLRANELDACRRGNQLRARIEHNNEVIRELFSAAAGARAKSGDVAIARQYEQLLTHLRSQPAVDCSRVVADPSSRP